MSKPIIAGADGRRGPSFTRQDRLRRALWNVAYVMLFRPSPRPMHAWRASLLRLFGGRLGKHVHVYPRARIWAPWNLNLADEASIADEVNCYSMAEITLKARAIVSHGAHLCTGTHDYTSANFQLVALPITIGENAWVCTEAFVGPGVTVGDDAVLGARSVAISDLPPGMVCAGHPAKPIKSRYGNPGERADGA